MRKTCNVVEMLEYANMQLARTDKFATKDFKVGISVMIEHILHLTGNYSGFMFLNNEDSDTGTLGYYSRYYFTNRKLEKK